MNKNHFVIYQAITTLFIPFWIGFGRMFFGVGGWLIIGSIIYTPILIVGMAILTALTYARKDIRSASRVGLFEVITWSTMVISGLVFGFTVVDFGDTEESVNSAFSAMFGHQYADLSSYIGTAAIYIFVISALVYFVYTLVRIIYSFIYVESSDQPDSAQIPNDQVDEYQSADAPKLPE